MTTGVSWRGITAGQGRFRWLRAHAAKTPSDLRRYPPENSQLPRGGRLQPGESKFFFGGRAEFSGGAR